MKLNERIAKKYEAELSDKRSGGLLDCQVKQMRIPESVWRYASSGYPTGIKRKANNSQSTNFYSIFFLLYTLSQRAAQII